MTSLFLYDLTMQIIITSVFCMITIFDLSTSAKNLRNNGSIDDTNYEILSEDYGCSPPSKWISLKTADGRLIENVCISKSYQSDRAPNLSGSVLVSTKANIIELKEQERQLTVILDVIVFWEDTRINIRNNEIRHYRYKMKCFLRVFVRIQPLLWQIFNGKQ